MDEERSYLCSYNNAKHHKKWTFYHKNPRDQSQHIIEPYIFLGTIGEETPDSYSQTVYKLQGETD